MTSASALVPLWDRAAEWQRRLAMIREARSFLYLSTFYLEYDAYAIELIGALGAAAKRGVAVQLLVDGFGQKLGGIVMSREQRASLREALARLESCGATVVWYHAPRRVQRTVGGGQHVKIQVSEAGEALLSSGNVTRVSYEEWNEYAVAVRGAVVRVLTESLTAIGGIVAPAHLEMLSAQAANDAEDLAIDYWFFNPNPAQGWRGPFGWRGSNPVTERLIEMLDAAQRSVLISSFYFKPTGMLMDAVLRAATRGVRVEVFHSHREALPTTDLAWIAAAVNYDRLLSAGVAIYENRRGEHSKIVLVDNAWAAFGSYNFEDAAHDRLAEAMLASRDPRAVAPIVEIFDGLRDDPRNVLVTPATFKDLPHALRARVRRLGWLKRWM